MTSPAYSLPYKVLTLDQPHKLHANANDWRNTKGTCKKNNSAVERSVFSVFFSSSLKTHKWLSSSHAWISFSQNFNLVNYTLDVAGCFWKPLSWSSARSHNMCLSWRKNGRNLRLVSYFGQSRIILAHTTITQIRACDQSKDELIKLFLALVSENILISLPLSYFAA